MWGKRGTKALRHKGMKERQSVCFPSCLCASVPSCLSSSLARLKVPDRHVLVVFQLELILDGRCLLTVAVGGDRQIPAQEIGRAILADVGCVIAERGRGWKQRYA